MDFIKIVLQSISPGLRKQFFTFVQSLASNMKNSDSSLDKIVIRYLLKLFSTKG